MDLTEAHKGIAGTENYFNPDRAPRAPQKSSAKRSITSCPAPARCVARFKNSAQRRGTQPLCSYGTCMSDGSGLLATLADLRFDRSSRIFTPEGALLPTMGPVNLTHGPDIVPKSIRYRDILEIREFVANLASELIANPPALVLGFATGSMQIMLPLASRIERMVPESSWFDEHPFVLYPGLNWEPKLVDGRTSAQIFTATLSKLIESLGEGRILLIDTMRGGGTMNKALKAIASAAKTVPSCRIELDVIAVVDRDAGAMQGKGLRLRLKDGSRRTVAPPAIDHPPTEVADEAAIEGTIGGGCVSVRLRYMRRALPLEDNEGAVDVYRWNHMVEGREPSFESLPIILDSGEPWTDMSHAPLAQRLFELLAMDEDSAAWTSLRTLNESNRTVGRQRLDEEVVRHVLIRSAPADDIHREISAASGALAAADVAFYVNHADIKPPAALWGRILYTITSARIPDDVDVTDPDLAEWVRALLDETQGLYELSHGLARCTFPSGCSTTERVSFWFDKIHGQ